jgi:hypothetical protein
VKDIEKTDRRPYMKSHLSFLDHPTPPQADSDSELPPLDEVPRRGVDWELFETDRGLQLQCVDSPDEREIRIFRSDDAAAAWVLYCACLPDEESTPPYPPARAECRQALAELVRDWEEE